MSAHDPEPSRKGDVWLWLLAFPGGEVGLIIVGILIALGIIGAVK